MRRVVVTGMGAITPLGSSLEKTWDGFISGESGIRRITQFDASDLPCQIAGEIPDFDVLDYLDRKEARRMPRSAQIGLAASIQAVKDAGLPDTMPEPQRAGVIFGTAIGGLDWADESIDFYRERGFPRVNPFSLPGAIPNLTSFLISQKFKCEGPNITITTACATGTQAIGEAFEKIRNGYADLIITGGTEALVRDFMIAGFSAMRALPVNFNDQPELASRPFDLNREGFVFSEGAAALVVESLEHALKRNVPIYAEIMGHASSSDAFHIAAPDPSGAGPIRAMKWALEDADIQPDDIDYINAHGSSTPLNDAMETLAIKRVFDGSAMDIPVTSSKSMIGHAMGATGAIEAISSILTIRNSIIPPTINYETPDPECDLDYVPNEARKQDVDIALSNSFGLGGQNACLILKKYQEL